MPSFIFSENYADTSHQMPSLTFSEKKKKKTGRNVFVISALNIKPCLICCTATAHKRINVREIVFYLKAGKFTDNSTH